MGRKANQWLKTIIFFLLPSSLWAFTCTSSNWLNLFFSLSYVFLGFTIALHQKTAISSLFNNLIPLSRITHHSLILLNISNLESKFLPQSIFILLLFYCYIFWSINWYSFLIVRKWSLHTGAHCIQINQRFFNIKPFGCSEAVNTVPNVV